jgi:enoyl-CoA hydratase/carnithine racemase
MADLLRRREGHVEILTLNRPEARNAINRSLAEALAKALSEAEADNGCRCIILTGAGDKAFSAGADLKALAAGVAPDISALVRRNVSKPLIDAVNGSALAGGFELLLSCDLAISVDTALFGIPEVRRGLIAAAGVSCVCQNACPDLWQWT